MKNHTSRKFWNIIFTIFVLTIALGISKVPTSDASENSGYMSDISKGENLNIFTSKEGLSFQYPLEWQILTMLDTDLTTPYEAYLEQLFDTKIDTLRSVEINFEKPHDIGPYDRTLDILIQDFVLSESPSSKEELVKKMTEFWEGKGEVKKVQSDSGINFVVWSGPSPVYEASLVMYVAEYTDSTGKKHFVQIERTGDDVESIEKEIEPLIDSLSFNNF